MATDMTKGNVAKHLTCFAIPLILGNIFQLTYNAVDSMIVGKYVGTEALASVGASGPIVNIVIFFIVGICTGTSILMSEYYGSGDLEKLHREISTSMAAGILFALAMTALGWILAPVVLRFMNTPEDIVGVSTVYLRIVFMGLIFSFLYNINSAILRSIGDSLIPVVFLIVTSVLNMILDYVFVVYWSLGVNGVAVATVIAQAASSVMCMVYINKKVPLVKVEWRKLKIDKVLLKDTINYSWITGMQQTCLYFGKILIQSTVNTLGIDSMAVFQVVDKIDDFAFQPQRSIGNSMTTFIAQNRGANEKKRMNAGLKAGMILEVFSWLAAGAIVFCFAKSIMGAFVLKKGRFIVQNGASVIDMGSSYLRLMSLFYVLPAMTNGIQGYFRGIGDLKITLASTFIQIVGRVFFAYLLIPVYGVPGIAYSCMAGWLCMLAFELPFFYISRKKARADNY